MDHSVKRLRDFHSLTLNFDLQPWPTTPGYPRSRSTLTPKIKVKGQTVKTGERPQTNGRTHGRYQTYYRPCNAVDNKLSPLIDIWVGMINLTFVLRWLKRHYYGWDSVQ